ncbi:ribonucleotide reductase subunit alpha [Ideonella sp.]|uniref:ribonucleotide reductase subunit alpha n=1 Tax=Ideonella sp. TaxID=1929293 RepID=UPI003BB75EBA
MVMREEANKLGDMEIKNFNDLLAAARQQPDAQRLLLVFAAASLPPDATADQRVRFEAGESGELAPLMCVDKDPAGLLDFETLRSEALAMGQDWALVFAAALSGHGGLPPAAAQVDAALARMVEAVKSGNVSGMIPFDRQGEAVQLD